MSRAVPVVALPAVGLPGAMWDGLGMDGWDLAPAAAGPVTLDGLAAQVARRLERVAPEGAVLVGLSMGGMVAQLVGLRAPRLVRGLVLAGTTAAIPDSLRGALRQRAERVRAVGMAGTLETTLERWFTAEFLAGRPAIVERVREWLLAADPAFNAGCWEAIAGFGVAGRLAELTMPARVVCGAADASTPPPMSRALAAGLPDASYVEVELAGHLLPLERPERFAALVREFVRDRVAAEVVRP